MNQQFELFRVLFNSVCLLPIKPHKKKFKGYQTVQNLFTGIVKSLVVIWELVVLKKKDVNDCSWGNQSYFKYKLDINGWLVYSQEYSIILKNNIWIIFFRTILYV